MQVETVFDADKKLSMLINPICSLMKPWRVGGYKSPRYHEVLQNFQSA